MLTGSCPACGAHLQLKEEISVSDRMRCPECGALLEFTGKEPFLVEWVEENWGFDDPFDIPRVEKIPRDKRTKPPVKLEERSKRRRHR